MTECFALIGKVVPINEWSGYQFGAKMQVSGVKCRISVEESSKELKPRTEFSRKHPIENRGEQEKTGETGGQARQYLHQDIVRD